MTTELDAQLEALNALTSEKASSDKPGDYLIVEDPEKVTTYHLQVKVDGKPDHRLMGAAWAALHGGYRGNKYEGPGKQEAIGKLRKLYEAENMTVPGGKEKRDAGLFAQLVNLLKEWTTKETSLDEQLQRIRNEFSEEFSTVYPTAGCWVSAIYTDFLICTSGEGSYQVGYTVTPDGDVEFDDFTQWVKVEPTWQAAKSAKLLYKAGARNSGQDLERLQKIHDLAVENGAQCTLKVYKGADGKLRWVTFSSTAFQDRDKEIVSTKALNDDVAEADQTKEYGPLRWWHVNGLDFGQCDYNAMSGKVLIESGTFNDEHIGASIKEAADDLAVSIGFVHPPTEPDAAGVFHHIRRFERSLLPADKASNLFTQLSVAKEQNDMTLLKEKFDQLVKLIGEGPAKALAEKAEQTEKEALAAGVAFKETPAPEPAAAKAESAPWAADTDKCWKACEALKERLDAHEKSHKEAHEAEAAEVAKATKERDDKIELLTAAVKELMGETPRAAKGFRASQEGPVREEKPGDGPQPNDAFKDFTGWMVQGAVPPAK